MDTITVIIHLTGLLLMVPPSNAGSPYTHALMPATDTIIPHVAILGFPRNATAQHCMNQEGDICFVNMDGWSLDPLEQSPPPLPGAVTLPRGVVNLTRAAGGARPVLPHYLRDFPGRRVRSRVTLRGGGVTESCKMGEWTYDPIGPAPAETLPMVNVLEWTIPDIRQDRIVLTRRALDAGPGDVHQTLAVLSPVGAEPIELLVAHISLDEVAAFARQFNLHSVSAAGEANTHTGSLAHQLSRGRAERNADDEVATHFHAYYDLLHAGLNERPLPVLHQIITDADCGQIQIWNRTVLSPTTVSCMVASGQQD